MRILSITFAILMAFCATGCFSLEHSKLDTTGEECVVVRNFGWKLFNVIPLFCGNATDEKKERRYGGVAFFRNDVTMEKLQTRFLDYAKSTGRRIEDVTYHCDNEIMLQIPLTGFYLPIPYLLCHSDIQISGVLR